MAKPMIRDLIIVEYVHGESRRNGPELPAPESSPIDPDPVDIIETERMSVVVETVSDERVPRGEYGSA